MTKKSIFQSIVLLVFMSSSCTHSTEYFCKKLWPALVIGTCAATVEYAMDHEGHLKKNLILSIDKLRNTTFGVGKYVFEMVDTSLDNTDITVDIAPTSLQVFEDTE